jgi:glutathione S-transferase
LAAQNYLVGDYFTVADAYLFTVLGWARMVKFDLSPFTNLLAYKERIATRPSVIAAMKAEGLLR